MIGSVGGASKIRYDSVRTNLFRVDSVDNVRFRDLFIECYYSGARYHEGVNRGIMFRNAENLFIGDVQFEKSQLAGKNNSKNIIMSNVRFRNRAWQPFSMNTVSYSIANNLYFYRCGGVTNNGADTSMSNTLNWDSGNYNVITNVVMDR